MTFSIGQLSFIVIAYLAFLFSTAYVVEKNWIPKRWVYHPAVYVFSLGVYASAWAFYGSVGLANQYGYGYLAYYIGISGAFALSPILLRPILHITRIYQLSSLADLLAFRYRSRLAGIMVSLFTIVVVIPMLTLQISAIADTLHLLNNELPVTTLAFAYCAVMVLFAILFGARHVSPREKHEGLVFALALESLVKLVAIVVLGGFVLWHVFAPLGGLEQWLVDNENLLAARQMTIQEGPWRTLLLVFFAAVVVMPHMFHMLFTENLNSNALKTASWALPLFLLIMAVAIPPILWAGIHLQLDTPAEYFALGIGIQLESPWLTIMTFVGGLAAASGIIIVITLSTAAMFLNHLVLPFYKPSPQQDFYRWLLWMRRLLLASILLIAYAFYSAVGTQLDLNRLGILAFVASLQFLPGVLGLLYWPRSNRKGFLFGLSAGIVVWVYAMLIPFSTYRMGWSVPFPLPEINESNWHIAALAAFGSNIVLFVLVSLSTKQKASERAAAKACSVDTVTHPSKRPLIAENSNDVITALSKPLGRYVAEREVYQALNDLKLPSYEDRPYALRRLRARLEANLSGLMGPTVAHDITSRYLPFKENAVLNEDIYQVEQRIEGFHDRLSGLAGELDNIRRYHRQTLERLPLGVCSLADDGEVMLWNQAMSDLTRIDAESTTGSHLNQLPAPWNEVLQSFVLNHSMHEYKKQVNIGARPRWFNLHKSIIQPSNGQPGSIVLLMEDQTEVQLLADELTHSERLASIGRLAAGVAHEIGNPVTAIDCLAQNMRYETEDPVLLEMAQQIQEQTQRITRIVQSLMNFSHAGNISSEHEPVQLAYVIEEAMQLLRLSKRSMDIEFINQCDPSALILGDPQRLVQIFVNLLSNARDASEPGQEVRATSSFDEHQVTIFITDQGEGISADVIDRLFEPFFTTKDVGKGTGLGLSLVYNLIEEHYGQINFESPVNNGRGTCVKVSLPRYHPHELTEPSL